MERQGEASEFGEATQTSNVGNHLSHSLIHRCVGSPQHEPGARSGGLLQH
jgi:hypothetical protein